MGAVKIRHRVSRRKSQQRRKKKQLQRGALRKSCCKERDGSAGNDGPAAWGGGNMEAVGENSVIAMGENEMCEQ